MKRLLVVATLALSLAACSAEGEPSGSPSTEAVAEDKATTATEVAEAIKADVPEVGKVVTITEDNDPNDKIGRPNGYTDGAVLFDKRAEPTDSEPTIDQGASLTVWPDDASAKAWSEHIQSLLEEAGGLIGSEYHYQSGGMLLRVTGVLKPSEAKAYEDAFKAATS